MSQTAAGRAAEHLCVKAGLLRRAPERHWAHRRCRRCTQLIGIVISRQVIWIVNISLLTIRNGGRWDEWNPRRPGHPHLDGEPATVATPRPDGVKAMREVVEDS